MPQPDDLPNDGPIADAADVADSDGGLGGDESIEETRRLITRRMQAMASRALSVYEQVMSMPTRNASAQLSAARDVLELLTEGKLQAPVVKQAPASAKPGDLAKLSEHIRLLKQDERRRA